MPDNIVEQAMKEAEEKMFVMNDKPMFSNEGLLAAFEKIKQHFEKGVVLRSEISDKTKGKIELITELISSLK